MRSLLKPLLFVLAVPVLATALGLLGRAEWDARWSSTLTRQLAVHRMRPDERLLARYSLATLCSDQRTAVRLPPCRTYNLFSSVIAGSAGVGGAGFVFLGALVAAAALSRRATGRAAWVFRPALMFAAAGTAAVALANAGLAVLATLTGNSYLFGGPVERASLPFVLVLGTAAVVWGLAMAVAALSVTRRPTLTLVARRVDGASQPGVIDDVRHLADAVGGQVPANVVATLAPATFVTEMKVACLDGVLSGRTLCVSLPLGRILTVDEFRALVAHELAHFSPDQEAYARHVAPFRSGALRALADLKAKSHGIMKPAVAPPIALLEFFFDEAGTTGDLSLRREFEADERAARAAGREALGTALVKVQAFSPAWDAVAYAMHDAVADGMQYENASALFQEVVDANAGPSRLVGIGQRRQEHPTDRHPTLAERLTALQLDLAQVAAGAIDTRPVSPAIGLFSDAAALERDLSEAGHELIRATGGEVLEPISG